MDVFGTFEPMFRRHSIGHSDNEEKNIVGFLESMFTTDFG
jgi:hypothetical protein